jgi:hypothetical protein
MLVGVSGDIGDFGEHALVVVVVESCEARFELIAPTRGAVHK